MSYGTENIPDDPDEGLTSEEVEESWSEKAPEHMRMGIEEDEK